MTKKTNEHSVGKKFPVAAVVAISVAAVLAIAFGSYMISYSRAVSLMEDGEFGKARETLVLYELTRRHDERLTAFLDAWEIMESGQLSEAKAAFAELGDYADAPQMVQETDYRQAALYMEAGQFRDAIELYTALAERGYKDSGEKMDGAGFALGEHALYETQNYEEAYDIFSGLSEKGYPGASEMCSEVRYLQAIDYAEKGMYAEACSNFLALEGYSDAESKLEEIYDKIYSEAVELYRNDEHIMALEYFMLIPHYADSQDYLTLLYLRGTTATRTISTSALVKELVGGALGGMKPLPYPSGRRLSWLFWILRTRRRY